MSTIEPPATGEPPPPPAPPPAPADAPPDDSDGGLGEGGKKALAAERKARKELEARLKDLEPLAAKAREAEDADKSEVQRAREAHATESAARKAAEAKLLRFEVGADKGVPGNLLRFLHGDTREELEEAADALLTEMGGKDAGPPKPKPGDRPRARLEGGQPSQTYEAMSPEQLAAVALD